MFGAPAGGGLFGGGAPSGGGMGGGMFGQPAGGGMFGQPTGGGMFGGQPTGGGMFGQPTGGGMFGATGGGMFGAQSSGGMFGQPTGGGMFGAASTGGGMFGQPTGGGLFGASSSGGMFGQPTGGGMFGQATGGGLYGGASSGGMFGQPATDPNAMEANFKQIGEQFAQAFYQPQNRQNLTQYYEPHSLLTFEGQDIQGAQQIVQKLGSLGQVQHQPSKCQCQPVPGSPDKVLVTVMGAMIVNGTQNMKFVEIFLLMKKPTGSWFILNNTFNVIQ